MMTDEMMLIRERMIKKHLQEEKIARAYDATGRLMPGELPGTFRLSNVDYSICLNSNWPVCEELSVTLLCASAWLQTGDDMYKIAAIGLLDDWLGHRYHNPNWWHNEIGVPMTMADIALLLWDDLDEERRKGVIEILEQGTFNKHPEFSKRWTGANLIWEAGNTIKAAILEEDEELLVNTVNRIAEEIDYSAEGIQKDGSFFQHGPLLYSGGYGRSFLAMLSSLLPTFSGTKYQLPKEKLDLIAFVLLDGLRYMTHRDSMDPSISGREYTRENALLIRNFADSLDNFLAVAEMPRKEEIREYREAIADRQVMPSAAGARYFPIAKFLTNRVGECFFSFKGADGKTLCTEHCNEEGVLGYNFSYGTHTTVMRSGKEYFNVYPIYDYARIPGTTAPAQNDEELYCAPKFNGRYLKGDRFGGVDFGGVAVCYEGVDHEGIHATVACFAVCDGMVILGTGISSDDGKELITTAEQNNGENFTVDGVDVHHEGVCYRNLDKSTEWRAEVREQKGSWKRNNRQSSKDREITGKVFNLTIDRKGGDSYAYEIMPDENAQPVYSVLQNDINAQAILLPDEKICAVIYKAGKYLWNGIEFEGEDNTVILN